MQTRMLQYVLTLSLLKLLLNNYQAAVDGVVWDRSSAARRAASPTASPSQNVTPDGVWTGLRKINAR